MIPGITVDDVGEVIWFPFSVDNEILAIVIIKQLECKAFSNAECEVLKLMGIIAQNIYSRIYLNESSKILNNAQDSLVQVSELVNVVQDRNPCFLIKFFCVIAHITVLFLYGMGKVYEIFFFFFLFSFLMAMCAKLRFLSLATIP